MCQIIADAFQFIDIGIGIHRQNTIDRHGPHIQLINLLVVDDRQVSGVVDPLLEIPDIFIGLCHIIGDVRIRTGRIGNCPEQITDKTDHRYNSRRSDHHNLAVQGKLLISKHPLPLSCCPVFFRRTALGLLENIAEIMRVFVAHFIADLRCFHR